MDEEKSATKLPVPAMSPTGLAVWPELGLAERRVLLELVRRGPQSRVRLAERVGLSRASLTRIGRVLLDLGLVVEGEPEAPGARGRPAEVLMPRADSAHFVGVKLTGDEVYIVLTDLIGVPIAEQQFTLPSKDVEDVVAVGVDAMADLLGDLPAPAAIGVAAAGEVVVEQGEPVLRRSHFLGWDGVPLKRRLEDATGRPVTLVNDVNALAGAHHWFGGEGRRSLVVFGVGAGIGSGIVLDDELRAGSLGRAGGVGHARIGGRGAACPLGHTDCVHSFVTMRGVEHAAGTGYADAVRRATLGDARARSAFERAAFALGIAVADAVNAVDPEVVAIMGEGTHALDLAPAAFQRGLADQLDRVAPEDVRLERPPFHFDLYAKAAAVMAMRELLS